MTVVTKTTLHLLNERFTEVVSRAKQTSKDEQARRQTGRSVRKHMSLELTLDPREKIDAVLAELDRLAAGGILPATLSTDDIRFNPRKQSFALNVESVTGRQRGTYRQFEAAKARLARDLESLIYAR